uniref:LysM domain-containing protein n=1 Tax=Candidatus Kentrum sp. FW TaxID=2126338 RepID=A0A450S8V0_9GAMM|nr:MAG: LysM domain-containing protein [Candidatus Kentron sp. FW]VFJ53475.1 MAG: LysM domain-containing protein [Candidatus Kentron sp. FW]
MENTGPGFHDDWQLKRTHRGQPLDNGNNLFPSGGTVSTRQVITAVGAVIIVTIAIMLFIFNAMISPVRDQSKEIKEMISALQDVRRSDMDILQARLDDQEEMLRGLLRTPLPKRVSGQGSGEPAVSGENRPSKKSPENTGEYILYAIKKNDTLGGIAERHKVSVRRILEENEINNPHKISIGQEIYIPVP